MANIDTLVEELGKLTVLEAVDLVKKLEETWGVSAAAPVAMAAGPAAGPARKMGRILCDRIRARARKTLPILQDGAAVFEGGSGHLKGR